MFTHPATLHWMSFPPALALVLVQELERDRARQALVPRQIHRSHATTGDPLEHAKSCDRGRQARLAEHPLAQASMHQVGPQRIGRRGAEARSSCDSVRSMGTRGLKHEAPSDARAERGGAA